MLWKTNGFRDTYILYIHVCILNNGNIVTASTYICKKTLARLKLYWQQLVSTRAIGKPVVSRELTVCISATLYYTESRIKKKNYINRIPKALLRTLCRILSSFCFSNVYGWSTTSTLFLYTIRLIKNLKHYWNTRNDWIGKNLINNNL